MKIIRAKDYADMSRKAANIISAQVIMKPNCVLGLATGGTPVGAYAQLVDWYNKGDIDFSEVTTVNLDVKENDEIILLTSTGKLVRTRVNEIRVLGRNTQGVTLISMEEGTKLVGLERVTENDDGDNASDTAAVEAEVVSETNAEEAELEAKDEAILKEEQNDENL